MNNLKTVSKIIKKAKSVALFTHISPDCDALGSVYALGLALENAGKMCQIFIKDEFTLNQNLIFDFNKVKKEFDKDDNFDLYISCDVSSISRLGDFGNIFGQKDNTIVLDHHLAQEEIGRVNFIDSTSSSCCEIVFKLLKIMKIKIDKQTAEYLYTGLSTDTGSFRNSNTNSNSYKTAYELSLIGADIAKINSQLYENKSLKEITFEKYLLNNYKTNNDIAYCLVTFETLQKLEGCKKDCTSFSHKLIKIQNINYSFSLVEETKGIFNLSLRSKLGYNVQRVAKVFGGGGHLCASGAKITGEDIQILADNIINEILKN